MNKLTSEISTRSNAVPYDVRDKSGPIIIRIAKHKNFGKETKEEKATHAYWVHTLKYTATHVS